MNKAYIYTDYTGNVLRIIDEEFDFPRDNFKNYTIYIKEKYEDINLVKEYKKIIKKSLSGKLAENIIWDVELTELYFRRVLRKCSTALGNSRDVMFEVLREKVYNLFFNYVVDFTKEEDFIIKIQKLFTLNNNYNGNNFFSQLIDNVNNKYKELNEEDLKEVYVLPKTNYKIPSSININTDTHRLVNIDKYYYNECYLQKGRYQSERDFEEFIKSNLDKIEFWIKNEDYGMEYFCMVYELDEEKREFYPDYIIKFNDGRVGIFEAKTNYDNIDETTKKQKDYINI